MNTASGWRRLTVGALWVVLWLGWAAGPLAAAPGGFRLQAMKGSVEVQAGGQGAWVAVRGGGRVASAGDRLRTGPGSAVQVVTSQGQRIAVGPQSEVVLQEPGPRSAWRVMLGKVLVFISGRQPLEVRAPAAVAAAEGTVFQVEVAEGGNTTLTVVEGEVRFFNEQGEVTVAAAQQSSAVPGQPPSRPLVVDAAGLVAWEASLQTLGTDLEAPQVGTDRRQLQQELEKREAALRLAPESPEALVAVSEVLLDLGRTAEALQAAERAAAVAPGAAAAQGVLGYALLQAGRPEEAAAHLKGAAEAQPDSPRWLLGLALLALAQRDSTPAVGLLERAAALAPQDPRLPAYLAAAHLRGGNLQAAAAAAAVAVRLGPEDYLTAVYQAYVFLAQGDAPAAVAAAQRAVAAAPDSALAQEALGTARFFAGDFAGAREALARALAQHPFAGGAHLALARLKAADNDLPGALQEASLAAALSPGSASARSTLGLLLLLNRDPVRAGREFQAALALAPDLAEAHTGWGLALARGGHLKEALDQQKAAVALDADSAAAHNNLGGVYASLGRMAEAAEHLQRALALQPSWALPYANLAVVHLERSEYPEALAAGEKAVALGERSPFVHTVLARVYLRQGRTDRALAQLRQAVALDPDYPAARFQLSRLYLQQDRSRDAVREVLGAVTTDPSAMTETRRYARTEHTLWGGAQDTLHSDGRHSDVAAEGRFAYHLAGLLERSHGYREVNQSTEESFAEALAGQQSRATQQWAFWGTFLSSENGLPGPTGTSPGDPDDTADYTGWDAVLACRQRLSPSVTATAKYSYRHSRYSFSNPDSLSAADSDSYRQLGQWQTQQSPEVRLDARLSDRSSVRLGYSRRFSHRNTRGVAGVLDPDTGLPVFESFAGQASPDTDTAWLEARTRVSDPLDLLVGGYWGRETGSGRVALPKVVAIYRPDSRTWWSLLATPIFRTDVLELAPVEALSDPRGLDYLNFVEGGAGRSYELRYQYLGPRSDCLSLGLAHQRVRGLLATVEDPALTGLPERLLVERGWRWIADAAYERWLADRLTGRLWARWQCTSGDFPEVGAVGAGWPYLPRWQAGARLDYLDDRGWRVGLDGTWTGTRRGGPDTPVRLGGYPLLNLQVQYQPNLRRSYFVRVVNLTDRDYETYAGLPQSGLALYLGAELRY